MIERLDDIELAATPRSAWRASTQLSASIWMTYELKFHPQALNGGKSSITASRRFSKETEEVLETPVRPRQNYPG
ncbi:hypothetical protein [Candidatus Reidiella endopervernicosa]|uniref:hypothetical protein n=1 Tax=Candidatus Reidiella endopervernicosa TaxID=2738883 RepID=UPI003B9692EB